MSIDDARPHLLDESSRTITVDEYLSGKLIDGWTADSGDEADETIIRSADVDLFVRVKTVGGLEAAQLCRGPSRDQSELVIQERVDGLHARKMAYDIAVSWTYVIVATVEEVADE